MNAELFVNNFSFKFSINWVWGNHIDFGINELLWMEWMRREGEH